MFKQWLTNEVLPLKDEGKIEFATAIEILSLMKESP
jgi:hypothetical protein